MIKLFGQDIPMIEASDEERQNKCTEIVNRALKQFDCTMVPRFMALGTNIIHDVTIMAKPREIPVPNNN